MAVAKKKKIAATSDLRIPAALKKYHYDEPNLLPVAVLDNDLLLHVDSPWPNPAPAGQQDQLELIYHTTDGKKRSVAKYPLSGPIKMPLSLHLPVKYLKAEGEVKVSYKIRRANGTSFTSAPTPFTVDRRIPLDGNAGPKPIVDDEVTYEDGITTDYLKKHCDVVKFRITAYPGQKVGDRVGLCCGGADEPPFIYAVVQRIGQDTVLAIPGDFFRHLADGVHATYYKLSSRAGYEGVNSKGTLIRIELMPRKKSKA